MTQHRHTIRSIAPDYIRAGVGLAVTAGPILVIPTAEPISWTLMFLVFLFAVYAANVVIRHLSIIETNDTGIAVSGPLSKSLRWQDLEEMRLKYFSTRRDGAHGWMQLVLKGSGVKIRIESTLGGFADIVKRAAKAANDGGLNLSSTTLGNLELLGVKTEVFASSSGSQ
ncbi:MAG: hypothetical protein ACPGRZ_06255 [Alphaproteobacteria bacterium]